MKILVMHASCERVHFYLYFGGIIHSVFKMKIALPKFSYINAKIGSCRHFLICYSSGMVKNR